MLGPMLGRGTNVAAAAFATAALVLGWLGGREREAAPRRPSSPPQPGRSLRLPGRNGENSQCDPNGLVEWLRGQGAEIHPGLRIGVAGPGKPRGVLAGSAVSPGARLFKLPDRLGLSADRTFRRLGLTPPGLPELSDPARATLYLGSAGAAREHSLLAAALVLERRQGRQSPHWQFLNCLPPLDACLSLPCFRAADREALADPYAQRVARADRGALLASLRATLTQVEPAWAGNDGPEAIELELIWAYGMVLSRSFLLGSTPRLLPFADMLNHANAGGGIEITTLRPAFGGEDIARAWEKSAPSTGIAAGSEVTWCYKKSATAFDLLYLYGFVDPSLTAVAIDLKWQAPTADARELALRLFRSIDPALIAERKEEEGEGEGRSGAVRISLLIGRLLRGAGIIPTTLAYARVVAAIELIGVRGRRSEHWEIIATATSEQLMEPSTSHPLGTAIESAALRTILALTPPPKALRPGTPANPAHLNPGEANGGGDPSSPRRDVATSFRKQRASAFAVTRSDATAALAALNPSPIDYFA